MTVHKHASMIKAKADNMELVAFSKRSDEVWREVAKDAWNWFEDREYFLCLPQHKEACLHWLNGGEVQTDRGCNDFVDTYPFSDYNGDWCDTFWYMLDDYASRTKPRKEKRWIAHFKSGDDFCTTQFSYKTIEQLKGATYAPNGFDSWQFIEIEVEV